MWGMDWPTALVVFSFFALAGWALWMSADPPPDPALVDAVEAMEPVVAAAQAWAEAEHGDLATEAALLDAVEEFNQEVARHGA
jgi:hypothetical protein